MGRKRLLAPAPSSLSKLPLGVFPWGGGALTSLLGVSLENKDNKGKPVESAESANQDACLKGKIFALNHILFMEDLSSCNRGAAAVIQRLLSSSSD